MNYTFFYETAIGEITITENGEAITNLQFGKEAPLPGTEVKETGLLKTAAAQIWEYFAGNRKVFELPLAPSGSAFQKAVWDALLQIPYGETRSYGQVAEAVGNPKAARAVGMANNKNPIAIIIPCHRVIGADGSLVGYGGGLQIKEQLLGLEKGRAGA